MTERKRKSSLLKEISELQRRVTDVVNFIMGDGSLPVGTDPDLVGSDGKPRPVDEAKKQKEQGAAKKNKGRKGQENEPEPAPKQEAPEPEWWYEHSSEYDQNGCRMSETSNDVYQRMRDDLAQGFSRHMRNQQRPY
jgi:hypothetical protein